MADAAAQLALDIAAPPAPRRIAGVDEAGRGPLAGPVVVAAVVLPPGRTPINGLADSKQLDAARRRVLAPRIRERALAWHVAVVEVDVIDRLNIFHATMQGMRECVEAVRDAADLARIDGNVVPKGLCRPGEAWVGGDARCRAIMAASILAKTHRDALMLELHARWPQYGFDQHKGYSTPQHLAALAQHGPCPAHRRSFAPVRQAGQPTAAGLLDSIVAAAASSPDPETVG
ncbi:ribonuclease HII [Lysobacter sp. N42]|uniref:ribonuclease HII n=1 Tax=Lysobacter sp. N42 TaxID=2545719 RepID=UPI0010431DB0|nr:ribonuclease HII [Lysobacter sp. N42]TCZ89017.1 ribonuclease HII [Lysobacter sp. N42]